jgi:hypothetical protein
MSAAPEVPPPRPLAQIHAAIARTARRLTELQKERERAQAVRQAGIVADYDAGLTRDAIARKWRLSYGAVSAVLHKARRSRKARLAEGLSLAQRRHYEIALRGGASAIVARRIAEAIGNSGG